MRAGHETPLWIVAEEQTHGRGRNGRKWHSPKGNLYASLLLKLEVSAATATQLSFVAGLAVHDAISSFLPSSGHDTLRLKWPNDLMLGGAKLAGILIESAPAPDGRGLAVITGIGVNVREVPSNLDRAVTSLGVDANSWAVFEILAETFARWLERWDSGAGFASIREAWLAHALALNEPATVNLNGSRLQGRFRGVDAGGALLLETEQGVVITVNAGDIYHDALG